MLVRSDGTPVVGHLEGEIHSLYTVTDRTACKLPKSSCLHWKDEREDSYSSLPDSSGSFFALPRPDRGFVAFVDGALAVLPFFGAGYRAINA